MNTEREQILYEVRVLRQGDTPTEGARLYVPSENTVTLLIECQDFREIESIEESRDYGFAYELSGGRDLTPEKRTEILNQGIISLGDMAGFGSLSELVASIRINSELEGVSA